MYSKPRNEIEKIHWTHLVDFRDVMTNPYKKHKTPELKKQIYCLTCNRGIRYMDTSEINHQNKNNFNKITLEYWNDHFLIKAHKLPTWSPRARIGHEVIWLNVKYIEKEQVKIFGAKWNSIEKQWYTTTDNVNLKSLHPWVKNLDEYSKLCRWYEESYGVY